MIDMSRFHGRINDLDSHLQPSLTTYGLAAGKVGEQFSANMREMLEKLPEKAARDLSTLMGGEEADEFTEQTVWNMKGARAPGAFTPEGRLKTLDVMGVDRAVIFSDPAVQSYAFGPGEVGLETMYHWNDFIVGFGNHAPERLRAVALLNTRDVAVAAAEVERVLKAGGRGFAIASSVPPGDLSPAHPQMDKIWAQLEEADATMYLHNGGHFGFLSSDSWAKGVEHLDFQPHDFVSETEQVNTYGFSTFHIAPEHFVSTIVLGGVFERFPRLRFGVIELGAVWLAPMAERLDQVQYVYEQRLSSVLSMKPSEYIQRNIRVTPFRFEPVADYIERYGLDDCYCFSSDFPHPEGGTAPITEFREKIARLGEEVAEKLFVTNAEWVLPALT